MVYAFHPTRRDLLLVLTLTVLFGLFLQLDLSLRFTDASGSDSLFGFKLGLGGGGDRDWNTDDRRQGSKHSATGQLEGTKGLQMTEGKIKWDHGKGTRSEVIQHAPGWTIFDNLYLFNGTFYIVTDQLSKVPLLRLMTSTGNEIWNDQESINGREPTDRDMRIIFPSEAKRLWGDSASRMVGTSFLCNDPPQFLDHYYHFAAELLFGLWRSYSSLDTSINSHGSTHLASPTRMIFTHTPATKWNDYAKMNSFLLRAIFPSMSYEYKSDFLDRADTARAFVMERVVFADRAAAFRGPHFATTWRTSAEAHSMPGSKHWWSPVRRNLLEFVGGGEETFLDLDEMGLEAETAEDEEEEMELQQMVRASEERALDERSTKPVITYVSRQEWGRRMLKKDDNDVLERELRHLEKQYGYEVNIVSMDKMTRDEQIRLAARTTIMLGVHGNGLTHLLWMKPSQKATVIEMFFPGGFAEDYEFTSRALGIKHYGFWNDESFTSPDLPAVAYPDGFQGNEIPVDGKAVADLIHARLSSTEPTHHSTLSVPIPEQ